jgi:hypothetical protein
MNQLQATTQFINEYLAGQWKAQKLRPSPRCSDEEFLRRASLDIIGRIATPEEVLAFVKDQAADKRAKLIDRLLASDEYPAYWARTWASWLLPRSVQTSRRERLGPFDCKGDLLEVAAHVPYPSVYREQLELWLNEEFSKNISHKELVEKLLTATGKTIENGAVNFVLAHLGTPTAVSRQTQDGAFDMVPITSRSVRLFLGYQIQLAQFDDHPSNTDIKQKHFWGINAFFRQVARDGNPGMQPVLMMQNPVLNLRDDPNYNAKGIVFYQKPNGVFLPSEPIFIDGRRIRAGTNQSRREALAEFMTTSKQFPRAAVSRMWGQFFGLGFNVFPTVDDFGAHNEVVFPELLDRLAKDFAEGGYDYKKLIRWICSSDAYHLQSVCNETNTEDLREAYLSRMPLRLLSPEQLGESLRVALQPRTQDVRDILQRIGLNYFGQRFDGNEWSDVPADDKLLYVLRFLNRKELADLYFSKDAGTLMKVSAEPDRTKALAQLYLATLNRQPTNKEVTRFNAEIEKEQKLPDKNVGQLWRDMFWSLLNSSEFILNH